MTAVAAPCAIDGLVIVNENAYCVPAATVWFVCTVSVSVPEVNAPFPCVVPSENRSAPALSYCTLLHFCRPTRCYFVIIATLLKIVEREQSPAESRATLAPSLRAEGE